jgi:hypothetical protein
VVSNAFIVPAHPGVLPLWMSPYLFGAHIKDKGRIFRPAHALGLTIFQRGHIFSGQSFWMMGTAVNQQVTMIATYLRSQLMTSQGQACNCRVGWRVSGAGLTWKGAKPEICGAHVFDACAQSFCTDGLYKHPAGNREVYMI